MAFVAKQRDPQCRAHRLVVGDLADSLLDLSEPACATVAGLGLEQLDSPEWRASSSDVLCAEKTPTRRQIFVRVFSDAARSPRPHHAMGSSEWAVGVPGGRGGLGCWWYICPQRTSSKSKYGGIQ